MLFNIAFVPLILAGLWFHLRGAVIACALTSVMSLLHLVLQLGPDHAHGLVSTVVLIVLYNVVGFTTGVLSERRAQALERAEAHAVALERNARALIQAEEVIARSERLHAVGELAAGMAHEIRNPLGGIRGAAEILAKDTTSSEVRTEFGRLMEDEIGRLDRVVRNFLQFARPSSAVVEHVRVADVLDSVMLLLGPDARRRGIQLANDVPAESVILASPDLFRQVLLNVALNAVQAQPSGGCVRISARALGDVMEFRVEDEGPGIPQEVRETMFDAFVTTRPDGSGLGLPIAHRLAKSMGGRVDLVATGASGTTFRIVMPRAPETGAAARRSDDVTAAR
jgi:signal transduction histidine kinase